MKSTKNNTLQIIWPVVAITFALLIAGCGHAGKGAKTTQKHETLKGRVAVPMNLSVDVPAATSAQPDQDSVVGYGSGSSIAAAAEYRGNQSVRVSAPKRYDYIDLMHCPPGPNKPHRH